MSNKNLIKKLREDNDEYLFSESSLKKESKDKVRKEVKAITSEEDATLFLMSYFSMTREEVIVLSVIDDELFTLLYSLHPTFSEQMETLRVSFIITDKLFLDNAIKAVVKIRKQFTRVDSKQYRDKLSLFLASAPRFFESGLYFSFEVSNPGSIEKTPLLENNVIKTEEQHEVFATYKNALYLLKKSVKIIKESNTDEEYLIPSSPRKTITVMMPRASTALIYENVMAIEPIRKKDE